MQSVTYANRKTRSGQRSPRGSQRFNEHVGNGRPAANRKSAKPRFRDVPQAGDDEKEHEPRRARHQRTLVEIAHKLGRSNEACERYER